MKNRTHYLYRHIRLDKNEVFYIGIGTVYKKDVDNYSQHIFYRRAYSNFKRSKNKIWSRIISKSKYEIEIMLESDDYEFIKSKEIEFIKLYGRKDLGTGCLANLTDGGDGMIGINRSDEFREKCRARQLGKKLSTETRDKMSKQRTENPYHKKQIIDIETGVIYKSAKEAAFLNNINERTLSGYLNNRRPNKTSLTYYNTKT